MQRSSSLSFTLLLCWGCLLNDRLPPEALWLIPIIAAYMLLEDNQRRGRLLVSWLATYLGVTAMSDRSPHRCGKCFNPWLRAGNEECPNAAKERREQERAMRESRARYEAALAAALREEGAR